MSDYDEEFAVDDDEDYDLVSLPHTAQAIPVDGEVLGPNVHPHLLTKPVFLGSLGVV